MIKPFGDRVLVRPLTPADQSEGGIFLPDAAQKRSNEAVVVAVGKGERLKSGEVIPVPLEPGDIVVHQEYSGLEVEVDGHDCLILNMEQVLAVSGNADELENG